MAKDSRGGPDQTGGTSSSQKGSAKNKLKQDDFNESLDKLAKAAMSKEMLAAGLAAAAAAISASPSARRKIRDAGVDAADSASNAASTFMTSASRFGALIAEAVAEAAQRMLSGDFFGTGDNKSAEKPDKAAPAAGDTKPTGGTKSAVTKRGVQNTKKPKGGGAKQPGRPRADKAAATATSEAAKSAKGVEGDKAQKRAPAKPRSRASTASAGRRGSAASRARGKGAKKDGAVDGDGKKGDDDK